MSRVTVIDYGLENIFRIQVECNCKIDGTDFTRGLYSTDRIPKEVLVEKSINSPYWAYKLNNERVSEEDSFKIGLLLEDIKTTGKLRDDDGMFPTREDLAKYDDMTYALNSRFVLVNHYEKIYEPIEFEIVKKQHIEDKYSDFIVSDVVKTYSGYPNYTEGYKAICTYNRNFAMMFRQIANKHGFTEVPDETFADNTKGMKYSISNTTPHRYTKCNNVFVSEKFKQFESKCFEETYEKCVAIFNKDYQDIENFILLRKADVEGKPLLNAAKVIESLELIKGIWYKVSVSKTQRTDYNSILHRINKLIEDISESIKPQS